MSDTVSGRVPDGTGLSSVDRSPTGLGASRFDPSRKHYRSQGYAMCTIDSGRDRDGAPISEVWTFASEDDYVEGYGWLEVRVHEIVETERSGALAVYYRQWFAPDGEPAWGKRPQRKVGALGSLKSLIRRRKMMPCDGEDGIAQDQRLSTKSIDVGGEG
ncbi:hypothetical protein LZK98_11640 [Sphingomonas cannabina]|uniref:hypothetical protein n=1 Tax=Sphingomonas cannabina TaxID=2899123 RepID=UPI001F427EE2|nr:hypothetical protein [Sphingomonas cannabina]UIJ43743.1 hypothetical protein LZK98_11640 [Sphingomonas cannabina]